MLVPALPLPRLAQVAAILKALTALCGLQELAYENASLASRQVRGKPLRTALAWLPAYEERARKNAQADRGWSKYAPGPGRA